MPNKTHRALPRYKISDFFRSLLGDRWSFYCVLDEAGKIILEQKVATTPEAMKQTFGKIPRSLIALETGTHSPWVSRLLTELGHEVIVAHAQKVQLITK